MLFFVVDAKEVVINAVLQSKFNIINTLYIFLKIVQFFYIMITICFYVQYNNSKVILKNTQLCDLADWYEYISTYIYVYKLLWSTPFHPPILKDDDNLPQPQQSVPMH